MSADAIVYCLEHLTDYRQFERLCSDVMNQSGYRDIEPLGGSNDRGRDALHISRADHSDITIFAYSVRGDWQKKLLNEDCRRIREEKHQLNRLVFVSTATINTTQRDTAKKEVLEKFGWTLELVDIERLRIRLSGDLRHLVAQHPAIFCPPFFPKRGGLSVADSRDTIVIDHTTDQHALATWLARRLQLAGYRTWCYGTAPLAGETPDESVRALIDKRAIRYLPVLSAGSVADVNFVGRCVIAAAIERLVIPCSASDYDGSSLPETVSRLMPVVFQNGWATGLGQLLESLAAHAITPCLGQEQGKSVALRSYVPEPVTREIPEAVYANTFATRLPGGIQVCDLARELSEVEKAEARKVWAFVEASSTRLLAFERPPEVVSLKANDRLPGYSWQHYEHRHGKRSRDVVKELVRRSLEVACHRAGLQWCDNRRVFFFPHGSKPQRNLSYVHVDGRKTWVAVTGEKTYGSGERARPFRYQLCPTFRVGWDSGDDWWVTMRIYVRITDSEGVPHEKKAITRRRKNVTKSWWNKEWFARTLAIMQALSEGGKEIVIGTRPGQVGVSTKPLAWDCPVSLDYQAVERIGDFQEEMADLRYVEEDDEFSEDENDESNE